MAAGIPADRGNHNWVVKESDSANRLGALASKQERIA